LDCHRAGPANELAVDANFAEVFLAPQRLAS
jgi:hypothetical protein